MKAFARTCQFVSGSDAGGASITGLSEPPQRTQTLGQYLVPALLQAMLSLFWLCCVHSLMS